MGDRPKLVGTLFLLMDLFAYVALGGVFSLSIVVCFLQSISLLTKNIKHHGSFLLSSPSLQQLSSVKLLQSISLLTKDIKHHGSFLLSSPSLQQLSSVKLLQSISLLTNDIKHHGSFLLSSPSLQQLSSVKLRPARGMKFTLL
jgi:uncharacterized protein YaaR (DUF327 family)